METPVPSNLVINPSDRMEWERRKIEWGESGPAHNINYVIHTTDRADINLSGASGNAPATSMDRQKQRTFFND